MDIDSPPRVFAIQSHGSKDMHVADLSQYHGFLKFDGVGQPFEIPFLIRGSYMSPLGGIEDAVVPAVDGLDNAR